MFGTIQHKLLGLLSCFSILLIAACSTVPRQYPAANAENYIRAEIAGMENIRFWGDKPAPYMDESIIRLQRAIESNPTLQKRVDVLALSGGAEDGAYGAGFLNGWTRRGDRPEFMMVTGISTGALIAPFAFLGSEYDLELKQLFTATSKGDIFFLRPFKALFGGMALGDTTPLKRRISKVIDKDFVEALARESSKGRLLQIGTTNLDAQRPVIWEIGKIAESDHPKKVELIQKIMLASASIPGVFPPVLIDVWIDGKHHQEVHVDGGVTNQIFFYPRGVDMKVIEWAVGSFPAKFAWVIRNTKLDPEYQATGLAVSDIAGRSISTLTKYQGSDNVINIATIAQRDGFKFHLTSVPSDFDVPLEEMFDTKYMRALYQRGYKEAQSKCPWTRFADGVLIK